MAEMAELAGNLLAELYNAQEDARLGLITPEQHMLRIETIRRRREAARLELAITLPLPDMGGTACTPQRI